MSDEQEVYKILYLDDSDVQLGAVRDTLARTGQRVVVAETVSEPVSKLDGVDLVIIDYHMPMMDGAHALRALKLKASTQAPPLFYLYTTDTEVAVSFKQLGFDGAFTRKGDPETLRAQFQAACRLLKLKRFRRERTTLA
jgi:PleD family two-component response regulator